MHCNLGHNAAPMRCIFLSENFEKKRTQAQGHRCTHIRFGDSPNSTYLVVQVLEHHNDFRSEHNSRNNGLNTTVIQSCPRFRTPSVAQDRARVEYFSSLRTYTHTHTHQPLWKMMCRRMDWKRSLEIVWTTAMPNQNSVN